MALMARIIGSSLLAAGLGVGLGLAFFGQNPDYGGISFVPVNCLDSNGETR